MSSQPDPSNSNSGDQEKQGEIVKQLLAALQSANQPLPISFYSSTPEAENKLKVDLNTRLIEMSPVTVAFPNCSDVMLSLIKSSSSNEITGFFNDYFKFCDHHLLADTTDLSEVVDQKLRDCTGKWFPSVKSSSCEDKMIEVAGASVSPGASAAASGFPADWPPFWCFPPTCVTLSGRRHLYPIGGVPSSGRVRRLFVADLVWLFYFERLGIFQILGRILDDYAYTGNLPISNGSLRSGAEDDVVAVVLEAMVRQTEAGTSSKVRDRNAAYGGAMGWATQVGRTLKQDLRANREFSKYFHQFIVKALEFYRDKRLAVAIRSTAVPSVNMSTETLTGISVTLGELKKTLEPFHYGRKYNNTLSGIVWVVGAMALIEKVREDLGIPRAYNSPHEFIPAAYNILVLGDKNAPIETSRYENHKICAEAGRDILLDIEQINHTDLATGGGLELWLNLIEGRIEAYRTAFRSLSGTDLGTTGTPVIEQEI